MAEANDAPAPPAPPPPPAPEPPEPPFDRFHRQLLQDRIDLVGVIMELKHRDTGRWRQATTIRLDYKQRKNRHGNWGRSYCWYVRLARPLHGVTREFWICITDIDDDLHPTWEDWQWSGM